MPWVSLEPPWQPGEEVAKIYAVSTPGSQLLASRRRGHEEWPPPCCAPLGRGVCRGGPQKGLPH